MKAGGNGYRTCALAFLKSFFVFVCLFVFFLKEFSSVIYIYFVFSPFQGFFYVFFFSMFFCFDVFFSRDQRIFHGCMMFYGPVPSFLFLKPWRKGHVFVSEEDLKRVTVCFFKWEVDL